MKKDRLGLYPEFCNLAEGLEEGLPLREALARSADTWALARWALDEAVGRVPQDRLHVHWMGYADLTREDRGVLVRRLGHGDNRAYLDTLNL